MATTYTITLDGHTFDRDEIPFHGPVEQLSEQVWSEQDVLGTGDPGTILTFLGTRSQKLAMRSVCDEATKDKLVALYNARLPVTLITPQDVGGFSVLLRDLVIEHEVPSENGKFDCRFTLTAR